MKQTLALVLLVFGSFGAFAEETIDCSDPVTQFVKPEICNQKDTSLSEEENEIYWCYAVTGFFHIGLERDDKEKLEKGEAKERLQKDWYQTFNMFTYYALKAQ